MDTDTINRFRRPTEKVTVGDHDLTLRKPSVVQHVALAHALGQIDLQPFCSALKPILDSSADGRGFVDALVSHGPALLSSILGAAGETAGHALGELVGKLLDNQGNHAALVAAKAIRDGEAEMEDQTYLQSAALQSWVARNVALDEAVYVVERAVALSNYAALGKAAAGLFKGATAGLFGVTMKTPPAATNGSEPSIDLETLTG